MSHGGRKEGFPGGDTGAGTGFPLSQGQPHSFWDLVRHQSRGPTTTSGFPRLSTTSLRLGALARTRKGAASPGRPIPKRRSSSLERPGASGPSGTLVLCWARAPRELDSVESAQSSGLQGRGRGQGVPGRGGGGGDPGAAGQLLLGWEAPTKAPGAWAGRARWG